jgi:hypothetical protein
MLISLVFRFQSLLKIVCISGSKFQIMFFYLLRKGLLIENSSVGCWLSFYGLSEFVLNVLQYSIELFQDQSFLGLRCTFFRKQMISVEAF